MRNVLVEVPHHVEYGVRRLGKMGQYESVGVAILGYLPEESALNISADANLSGFEDKSPDVSLLFKLGL